MKNALVIGDVHGHYDRLTALLKQEGIIEQGDEGWVNGPKRDESLVIQLGDLGHFGMDRAGPLRVKSPTADLLCYELAAAGFIDVVLWGNHDRAVPDSWHAFGGYAPPPEKTKALMQRMRASGQLRLAHSVYGFLLTHAGLHKQFKHNDVPAKWKTDPVILASELNRFDIELMGEQPTAADVALQATRDAIGAHRGGRSNYGGILWRDASESLHDEFRQIFGHTSRDGKVRKYQSPNGYSYCIDIGNASNGKLAGIWLPSERVVEVQCLAAT